MGCESTKEDQFQQMSLKKFNILHVIGRGGFGKVWKIENKKSKIQYALKQIQKAKVLQKKSVGSVLNQRQLLQCLYHPFLINIVYAFQTKQNLYLVMDLVNGGDLRYHLIKKVKFTEQQAKFMIACIILALQYLHNNGIIHRDIKPENLVFQSKGYLRLTDLGIARIWKPQNSTDTSGTPGYMAPEVMCRNNHGVAADYFAIGVILYQLIIGRRPYAGKTRQQIRDNILSKQVQIRKNQIPNGWSNSAIDIVNKLIQRKPQNRLGFNGPQEVMDHVWFDKLDWDKLLKKELVPTFLPEYNSYQYEQQFMKNEEPADIQSKVLLRRNSIQKLFKQYEFDGVNVHNPLLEPSITNISQQLVS